LSFSDDIQGEEFRKIVENELFEISNTYHMECSKKRLSEFHEDLDSYTSHLRSQTAKDRLDRHKIMAAVTLCVLRAEPLCVTGVDDQKVAYYSNEILAYNVCCRILKEYIDVDMEERFPGKEFNWARETPTLTIPERLKDENPVESCILHAFLKLKHKLSTFGYADAHLEGCLLQTACIYYFIDQYNQNVIYDALKATPPR
jgi:hypothetical protein